MYSKAAAGAEARSIAEGANKESLVGAPLIGTDPDNVNNIAPQALTYSIIAGNGNNPGAFKVDAASGQLRVNTASMLDREKTPLFTLTVEVTDPSGLKGHGQVKVTVVDQNDPPTLVSSSRSIHRGSGASPSTFGSGSVVIRVVES